MCSQLCATSSACWCVACGGQAPHQLHTAARCVQPVVCSQPRLPSCVHRTLRVSDVRSRLYRRLRIFRDLQLVGWRASVGSTFNYAVRVSAPGFLACVRLRVFGSRVRSGWRWSFAWGGSGRVFAPFRGGCSPWVGCLVFVWVVGCCFLVFPFVLFCWYDMLPRCSGCAALLAPALWLSLRWGLRVFAPPVLCVLPAWSVVGSACCCRRRGSFRRFLLFTALAWAGLSFWLVLSCIDVRGPGSGMRDA